MTPHRRPRAPPCPALPGEADSNPPGNRGAVSAPFCANVKGSAEAGQGNSEVRFWCRKKAILSLLAAGYLAALFLALLVVKSEPLAICYQWGYYLLLIAFLEELIFRGVLPLLMEKSGVPAWVVWVLPGVLFACMHTLMPMVQNGFAAESFVLHLLSVLGGYTVGHCGFYALRKWFGTLWLPILVHGLLDFSSVFIT